LLVTFDGTASRIVQDEEWAVTVVFHSGEASGELLDTDPRKVVERAVWGMLPKNRLSRKLISKLKVYSGPEHPHAAQKPQPYQITQISQISSEK
jgi:ribosomal protein L13